MKPQTNPDETERNLYQLITPRRLTALVIAITFMSGGQLVAEPSLVPPDLTKGTTVDRELTYNLGPTGLRGWIHTRPDSYLDGEHGRTTSQSRQILVTHVGAKSPADGVMQVNDVILVVDGKPFSDDARKSIAYAIQEAEQEANGGTLKLTRWRAGKTEEVQLKLRVMGTYSPSSWHSITAARTLPLLRLSW